MAHPCREGAKTRGSMKYVQRGAFAWLMALFFLIGLSTKGACAMELEIWHADSLAGPMLALSAAFEAAHPEVKIHLTSGVSKELAAKIAAGGACDVFAPSSPEVIKTTLMSAANGPAAANWYAVFSANEMVLVLPPGNPGHVGAVSDLLRGGARLARVTGEKDLATGRSLEFIKRATAAEGKADAAASLIAALPENWPEQALVPEVIAAISNGRAQAGVVYLSAAVAAGDKVSYLRFPASVNMNEAIRNAATVPAGARQTAMAVRFVHFLLSEQGQRILEQTGQPPIVPPVIVGAMP